MLLYMKVSIYYESVFQIFDILMVKLKCSVRRSSYKIIYTPSIHNYKGFWPLLEILRVKRKD